MRYGDSDNARNDVKTLHEIFDRQGANMLIDVIAEKVGETAIKFKMSEEESKEAMNSLLKELKESILERI